MSKLAGLSGAQSLGLAAVGAVAVAAAVAWFGGAFDREAEVAQPVALMPAPKVSAPVVDAPKAAPEPVAVAPKPEEAAPAPAPAGQTEVITRRFVLFNWTQVGGQEGLRKIGAR